MELKYISHTHIDKNKWDACIDVADNGLIYAYSFYLDTMSEHWDAIVLNDYEMVMPLPWRKKYLVQYLYQPPYSASLGIFGNNLGEKVVNGFLKKIPSKFRYWDIYLNRANLFSLPDFPMYKRNNYVLPLSESYEKLKNRYASSHVRNIKRAMQSGNLVKKDIPIDQVVSLAKEQFSSFGQKNDDAFLDITNLYHILKKQNQACTYGVFSSQNQLVAACALFFSNKRAYYILVGNHPNGKTTGASHFMIDHFIREYSGKDLTLDFEGSNIASLAFFYKSFGAQLEIYPGIKLNKLPTVARLFKQ